MSEAEFFETARERYRIKLKRDEGLPAPWTDDPVFQQWRFCNVFREDDKVTQWIRRFMRAPLCSGNDPTLIITWTAVGRFINRVESLSRVCHLVGMDWPTARAHFLENLRDVHPLTSAAYYVKTPSGFRKLDGIARIIDGLWPVAEAKREQPPWTCLEAAYDELSQVPFFGSFMAYEIVSDLRWTPLLLHGYDTHTWANPGPGCCRGLSRIDGREYRYTGKKDRTAVIGRMRELLQASREDTNWPCDWPAWEMREVEHWLCEYDKWCKATHDSRWLKQKYSR